VKTKMAKHNKKRNVGLLHEQLVRHASENLVAGDKKRADQGIELLQHHFRENTELHKEFRLFNALVHTRVPNRNLARQIIAESRSACLNHDANKLRSEKSNLIREINHKIDNSNFYSRKISKYKTFATVQALLNEWRGGQKLGPDEIVKYENVLEAWLVREPEESEFNSESEANPLSLKIMTEKFNKKYRTLLNEEQRQIIENRLSGRNNDELSFQIAAIKEQAMKSLEKFYQTCDNKVLLEKREQLEKKIASLDNTHIEDAASKAMVISSLISEIEDEDE